MVDYPTTITALQRAVNNLKHDLQFGYTTIGPQRADLQILVGKIPAKDALSRGQQKLLPTVARACAPREAHCRRERNGALQRARQGLIARRADRVREKRQRPAA